MKSTRRTCCLGVILISSYAPIAAAQQPAPPTTLQGILAALSEAFSGGKAVQKLQLSGTANWYAGSTQDSGPATLTASADGSVQLQIALASLGEHSETVTNAVSSGTCQWVGSDGVVHDNSGIDCWTSVAWFLPQLSLQPAIPTSTLSTSYQGIQSTKNGTSYVLKSQLIVPAATKSSDSASRIESQSMTTLHVDAVSLLPTTLDYMTLSDSGSRAISVEIRYSHYESLNGLMVPSRIERYLNGSLELGINVSQASILN